jgi:hypothetical protein
MPPALPKDRAVTTGFALARRASRLLPRAPRDTCSVYHCSEFEIASPLRCERKLLANQCRVFAACEGEHFAMDGIAKEAAKMNLLLSSLVEKS